MRRVPAPCADAGLTGARKAGPLRARGRPRRPPPGSQALPQPRPLAGQAEFQKLAGSFHDLTQTSALTGQWPQCPCRLSRRGNVDAVPRAAARAIRSPRWRVGTSRAAPAPRRRAALAPRRPPQRRRGPRRPAARRSPAVVRLQADAAAAPVHLGARPAGHGALRRPPSAPRPGRAGPGAGPPAAGRQVGPTAERGRERAARGPGGAGPANSAGLGRRAGREGARPAGTRAESGVRPRGGGPTWRRARRPIGGAGGPGAGAVAPAANKGEAGPPPGPIPGGHRGRSPMAQRGDATCRAGRGPPAANGRARGPALPGNLRRCGRRALGEHPPRAGPLRALGSRARRS